MEIVSRAEFARRVGISRVTVTQAVQRGRLPSVGGNIDLDDPEIRAYMARHAASTSAGPLGGRPIAVSDPEPLTPPPDSASTSDPSPLPRDFDGVDLVKEQRYWGKEHQKSKTLRSDHQYRLEIRESIPFDVAARSVNIFATTLEQQFGQFDMRLAADIVGAVAAGGGQIEIAAILKREIDTAVDATIAATRRATRAMKITGRDDDEIVGDLPAAEAP